MATQTIANITNENKTFYDRVLLDRLVPELLFYKYAVKKALPKNGGTKINFRRFDTIAPTKNLDGTIRALTEGVTPSETSNTVSKVEVTVAQYGDFIIVSDFLDMAGIDPFITETADAMGESAAMAIDTQLRDVVCAGTNVQYAGGGTDADDITATNVMTSTEIKKAVRTLKKANAKPVEGKFYVMFVDPEIHYDLQNDTEWQDVSKYNGGEAIIEGEVGKIHGVKVIVTTNLKVENNTNAIPVHSALIFGRNAFGCADIENGATPEMIIKTSNGDTSNTADPLNQRNTIGWKANFAGVRLNELAMIRLECAVSA